MTHRDEHKVADPDPWVLQYADAISAGGRVLDLACGAGRHTRLLVSLGYQVTAVDKATEALADLHNVHGVSIRNLDLETDTWPLAGQLYDGIVVTNYLHRPHLPRLIDNLTDRGALLYSTFAAGHEIWGRPRNPDFLLQPGELQRVFGSRLYVVAYEENRQQEPPVPVRQSIFAVARGHPLARN
jgi:SAM-dependent methyltransferase